MIDKDGNDRRRPALTVSRKGGQVPGRRTQGLHGLGKGDGRAQQGGTRPKPVVSWYPLCHVTPRSVKSRRHLKPLLRAIYPPRNARNRLSCRSSTSPCGRTWAGPGDITSLAVVPDEMRSAILWSKDDGVLAGEEVFAAVFTAIDPEVGVRFDAHDGAKLTKGMRVAEVQGRALSSFPRNAPPSISSPSFPESPRRHGTWWTLPEDPAAPSSWIPARPCPAGARSRSTRSPWEAAGIIARAFTTWC